MSILQVLDLNIEKFCNNTVKIKKDRCIVRLTTSIWSDKRGLHIKKDINYLNKLCIDFNILKEDSLMIGANDVVSKIINLDECKDGTYEIITCDFDLNKEDYNYKLIPFIIERKK
jgi:hypothetical protein